MEPFNIFNLVISGATIVTSWIAGLIAAVLYIGKLKTQVEGLPCIVDPKYLERKHTSSTMLTSYAGKVDSLSERVDDLAEICDTLRPMPTQLSALDRLLTVEVKYIREELAEIKRVVGR